ncbi:MAG: c-type cytochrome domain-containing protein, partial [Anaerolineales bacterium]
LRPARETCELCHFPEKFSDDSLREIKRFKSDFENTPLSTYLTLKTGGGSKRAGLGRGIHWHIENPVYYFASDPEEQQIPYVKIVDEDGNITEYIDTEAVFNLSDVQESELVEMDCITCHNRITHLVPSPEDTIDQLLASGAISRDIPEIRSKSLGAYSEVFNSTQMGLNNIEGLVGYYQTYHPDYFQDNQDKIAEAVEALKNAYATSVFPQQNSDWTTHPNNIGHKDSPGCFRCHDGKHLNAEKEAIRLECNLCHSIPVVAGPYDFVADIEISRGPEPQSHLNENWISMHHQVYDETCQNCHTTANPGGTDNSSFCSNSACHGTEWVYAGFDAPGLRDILVSQLPPTPTPAPIPSGGPLTFTDTIGPILGSRCSGCHGTEGIQGLNLTDYQSILTGGESGPAVVPGDPGASLIVIKNSQELPHFGQLSTEELDLIVQWITGGAPEN